MEYEFTLKYWLTTADSDADELVERLGAAGCDDALVGIGQPGRIALDFSREARSAQAAVVSALFCSLRGGGQFFSPIGLIQFHQQIQKIHRQCWSMRSNARIPVCSQLRKRIRLFQHGYFNLRRFRCCYGVCLRFHQVGHQRFHLFPVCAQKFFAAVVCFLYQKAYFSINCLGCLLAS